MANNIEVVDANGVKRITKTTEELGGIHVAHRRIDNFPGNTEGTLLNQAVRNATTPTADQTNTNSRGVMLFIDVKDVAPSGTETLNIVVEVKDPANGGYVAIYNSALTAGAGFSTASGVKAYLIHPDAAETQDNPNLYAQAIPLSRTWRARVVHSASGSWNYSLGYSLLA